MLGTPKNIPKTNMNMERLNNPHFQLAYSISGFNPACTCQQRLRAKEQSLETSPEATWSLGSGYLALGFGRPGRKNTKF